MTPPDPVYLKRRTTPDDDFAGISQEALLVRDTLIEKGMETPMVYTGLNNEQKYQRIRELIQSQKFAAIGQAVTGIQHAIKNMLSGLTPQTATVSMRASARGTRG